jgi:signal peptidase II
LLSLGFADLNLQYTVNTGINFGLGGAETTSRQVLLASVAILICGFVILWAIKSRKSIDAVIAGLFAGGGLANALERVAYGGVFDYLNVPLSFYNNPYAFNIADIYIFVGAIIFILRPGEDSNPGKNI